jgi:methylmalonyl-CoA mutase
VRLGAVEAMPADLDRIRSAARASTTPVLGITGTGGFGKSSLTDELVRRFRTSTTS